MFDDSPEAAERAVLGSILLRPDVVDDIALEPDDFKHPGYEALYALMRSMRYNGQPIDVVTVCEAVRKSSEPAFHGFNDSDIHGLIDDCPSPTSAPYYEAIVARAAVVRRLQTAKARMDQAAASDMTADELIEAARKAIDGVAGQLRIQARPIADDLDAAIDALEKKPEYHPSPWQELNNIIGGFEPGGLYVIGARPGVGKSVVALQCAIWLTLRGNVAFSSLEMSRMELLHRAISQGAEVGGTAITTRSLSKSDWDKVARADRKLRSMPLFIDDRANVTVTQVWQHARNVQRHGKLSGVILDYLQLMRSERGDSKKPRHEVVAEYSRQLKIMARELDVPVIALSQLNRASTQRADGRPQIADLRESGAVEQDADVVILLHRVLDDPDKARYLHMYVAKHRNGPTGNLTLDFLGHFSKARSRGLM